jgi:hypothetical protein
MSSKKGRGGAREALGEFVWVLDGKTLHPARLALPRNLDESHGIRLSAVEIQWTQTGFFQMVPRENVQFQEGRRPRRRSAAVAKEESKTPTSTKRKSIAKPSIKTAAKKPVQVTYIPPKMPSKKETVAVHSLAPEAEAEAEAEAEETTRWSKGAENMTERPGVRRKRLLEDVSDTGTHEEHFAKKNKDGDNAAYGVFPQSDSTPGKGKAPAPVLVGKNSNPTKDCESKIEELSTAMDQENAGIGMLTRIQSSPLSLPRVDQQSETTATVETRDDGESNDGSAMNKEKEASATPPLSPMDQEFGDASTAADAFETKSAAQGGSGSGSGSIAERTEGVNKSVPESSVLDSLAAAKGLVVSKFLGLYNIIRGSSSH